MNQTHLLSYENGAGDVQSELTDVAQDVAIKIIPSLHNSHVHYECSSLEEPDGSHKES